MGEVSLQSQRLFSLPFSLPKHGSSGAWEIQTCPHWFFFFSLVGCTLCGKFSFSRAGVVRCARGKCISTCSAFESGEWMSPSEEFPPQEFVYVICIMMSAFPLVPLCKCQSRLKVSVRLILRVEKSFFFLPFFFPQVLTQNLLLY